MKDIFTKNWKSKIMLGLDSSEEIPNFTNHEIPQRNIKCDIFTTQLWNNIYINKILKELRILVKALKQSTRSLESVYLEFSKIL